MDTIDCLTECKNCRVSFIKPYKNTDMYLLDLYKRYDTSLCDSCLSDARPIVDIKSAITTYNKNLEAGYNSILELTRTVKDYWGV